MSDINKSAEIEAGVATPENTTPKTPATEPIKIFGLVGANEFTTYMGASLYGCVENARAMGFLPPPGGVDILPGNNVARASEGLQKIFDQNTGDGTIVALGFIGADVLLSTAGNISKRLGKKGIDPTIRFLTSVTFGTALATYLETTKFMNNTVDLKWGGDLFGVALGVAAILSSKVIADRVTIKNITEFSNKTKAFIETTTPKLRAFSENLVNKLKKIKDTNKIDDQTVNNLSEEYLVLINEDREQSEQPINPAI